MGCPSTTNLHVTQHSGCSYDTNLALKLFFMAMSLPPLIMLPPSRFLSDLKVK